MYKHPECMIAEDIQLATIDDKHIDVLSNYIFHGWLSTKNGSPKGSTTVLVFQRQNCGHRRNCHERNNNNKNNNNSNNNNSGGINISLNE